MSYYLQWEKKNKKRIEKWKCLMNELEQSRGCGMGWHYQVRSRPCSKGLAYDIVEFYGKPFGHTAESIAPVSESRGGLIQVLEMMLHDAKKYRTIAEKKRGKP